MAIGAENGRAGSVINDLRPVYVLPHDGGHTDLEPPKDEAALPQITSAVLRNLADSQAPQVALLKIEEGGTFHAEATAWPFTTDQSGGKTSRFLTAGHVLRSVLGRDLKFSGNVQDPSFIKRQAQVVFPDGSAFAVKRWICSSALDLAVFEIEGACDALVLDTDLNHAVPASVAVIGYPLVPDVAVFAAQVDPYVGQQFLAVGLTRPINGSDDFQKTQFCHDATTLPGFSGAPILNPETGHVIGLHIQGSRHGLEDSVEIVGQRDPVETDWNDGIPVSGMLLQDGLRDILHGDTDTPPSNSKTIHWSGDRVPGRSKLTESRPLAMRLADTGAARGTGIAGEDGGVVADRPDSRDRLYQPGLAPAPQRLIPPCGPVGDQGTEGSCAAFALAGAIEIQLARRNGYRPPQQGLTASVRMLDRMARRHDEWLDDTPDGTSLRAVIKGFHHNGVCPEDLCAYIPRRPAFFLTRTIAKAARKITLGAYLRVRLSVDDMRMAIADAGAVIVTADVHDGWKSLDRWGRIPFDVADPPPPPPRVRHAFLVTGYDRNGFIVQNARGPGWGGYRRLPGHALWKFADWAENCRDAWAIRLAPRDDHAFALSPMSESATAAPRRLGLLGHALHAERFGLVEDGTLGLGLRGVAETAAYLDSDSARRTYPRLMLLFHEPLMDGDLIARLALRLTTRLKAQGVYPLHIVYGLDEMLACRLRLSHDIAVAVERYLREGGSRDAALQRQLGPVIRAQVDHFADGARILAAPLLRDALAPLEMCAMPGRQVDVVSVGLGGVVAAQVCAVLTKPRVPHLAMACPVDVRATRHRRLGTAMDEADMPGWLGSWGDIVAGAFGRSIRSSRGADAASAQALLSAPRFVEDLLTLLPFDKAAVRPV
ncbi:trypsin-like peptidase domain-containing protein [uncultured Paracoccus sp.]|uniref:trypsin-like peptidase domain-containing protein n=1 Tax=uncultured Paracoccus sp. TaxID=189685 RepID=UPI0025EB3EE2|nr:trypsin-like peptidase domain-containing protein [uncultured Paracoccus sp.]